MFILRKITKKGEEMNISLGHNYTLIHKERSPEEFEKFINDYGHDERIFAFISNDRGYQMPISKEQTILILCENGEQYDKIF